MRFADPAEIEELAARLDARAEQVREHVRTFKRRTDDVAWHSAGAARYRTRCAGLRADLERNAQGLNDAADLLRAHAREVGETIQWMHAMVDRLRQEALDAWNSVERAADDVFEWGADAADEAWDTVTGWL